RVLDGEPVPGHDCAADAQILDDAEDDCLRDWIRDCAVGAVADRLNDSMKLYDLDPGADCPEIVRMIVEIPKNSANKYEYDGELGVFRLDRALYSPMHYP